MLRAGIPEGKLSHGTVRWQLSSSPNGSIGSITFGQWRGFLQAGVPSNEDKRMSDRHDHSSHLICPAMSLWLCSLPSSGASDGIRLLVLVPSCCFSCSALCWEILTGAAPAMRTMPENSMIHSRGGGPITPPCPDEGVNLRLMKQSTADSSAGTIDQESTTTLFFVPPPCVLPM